MGWLDQYGRALDPTTAVEGEPTKASDHNGNRTAGQFLANSKACVIPGLGDAMAYVPTPNQESGGEFWYWGYLQDINHGGAHTTIIDPAQYVGADVVNNADGVTPRTFPQSGFLYRMVTIEVWAKYCNDYPEYFCPGRSSTDASKSDGWINDSPVPTDAKFDLHKEIYVYAGKQLLTIGQNTIDPTGATPGSSPNAAYFQVDDNSQGGPSYFLFNFDGAGALQCRYFEHNLEWAVMIMRIRWSPIYPIATP